MTPSFRIGQEVQVIETGKRFFIEQIILAEHNTIKYSARSEGEYYPASSLRLVSEELKIGDWVQVIGQPKACHGYNTGWVGKVEGIGYSGGRRVESLFYDSSALRKLTPEEVQAHFHPEIELSQDVKKKIVKAFLAQIARSDEVEERLAAIQDRLKEDRNLMMEIEERFDERQDAIESDNEIMQKRLTKTEKLQADQHERMDGFMQDYREHKDFDFRMHDRIKVLEAYQRGEMPDCKPNDDLVAQRDYVLNRIAEDMMLLLDENFIVDSKMRAKEHVWLGELESLNERLDGMRGGKP